ncbi:MAG: DUF4293 domain-containing protein [Saprospiraceae bacterium]|nr:DUF4293 domain-containing protein [Saprospiraceae bacterium]
MIQRIQSILLLFSGIAFLSLFKAPFAISDQPVPNLLSDMVYNIQDNPILLVLTILGGLISIGAIFLYNKRDLQLKLTYIGIVISILLPLVAFLLIYNERTLNSAGTAIHDQFGLYLPFISLVLSIVAARFIKKDENTVRSMDRLR